MVAVASLSPLRGAPWTLMIAFHGNGNNWRTSAAARRRDRPAGRVKPGQDDVMQSRTRPIPVRRPLRPLPRRSRPGLRSGRRRGRREGDLLCGSKNGNIVTLERRAQKCVRRHAGATDLRKNAAHRVPYFDPSENCRRVRRYLVSVFEDGRNEPKRRVAFLSYLAGGCQNSIFVPSGSRMEANLPV